MHMHTYTYMHTYTSSRVDVSVDLCVWLSSWVHFHIVSACTPSRYSMQACIHTDNCICFILSIMLRAFTGKLDPVSFQKHPVFMDDRRLISSDVSAMNYGFGQKDTESKCLVFNICSSPTPTCCCLDCWCVYDRGCCCCCCCRWHGPWP